MASGGAFSPAARSAALGAHLGRCVSCAARATEVHHRAPRRAGGTRRREISEPHNAAPMCQGCHRFIESHREVGYALGWLLHEPDPAAPYWTRLLGWCTWTLLTDGENPTWCIRTNQPTPDARAAEVAARYQKGLSK